MLGQVCPLVQEPRYEGSMRMCVYMYECRHIDTINIHIHMYTHVHVYEIHTPLLIVTICKEARLEASYLGRLDPS